MKGVIFNILEEMVIEHKGMAVWNDILNQEMNDEGVYTAGESYPDEKLFALVHAVSKHTNLAIEEVLATFGEFLFGKLAARYPVFIEGAADLKTFLKSIDSVIHVEVKKLYNNPNLPSFTYSEPSSDVLVMYYHSPRKLCLLAEGLIRGAASHYETPIQLSHPVCMHQGAPKCELSVRFL